MRIRIGIKDNILCLVDPEGVSYVYNVAYPTRSDLAEIGNMFLKLAEGTHPTNCGFQPVPAGVMTYPEIHGISLTNFPDI